MIKDFKFKRAYFVDLAERYAIDGYLLGKRLSFCYGSSHLSLVIPSIIKQGRYPVLGIANSLDKYGIVEDDWGKINSYDSINKPNTIDAWLSRVLVECYSNESNALLDSYAVENLMKRVLYALQIVNPDAIRIPSDNVPNVLCEVTHSVSFEEDEIPRLNILIASVIDDSVSKLNIEDIRLGLKNAYKSVTLPYEMLDNARRNLVRHDTRAVILNCSTAIEVMLNKKVITYFDVNHVPTELQEYALKQSNGYNKLVNLCKIIRVSLDGIPNISESVFNIRNRVIHGGLTPSYVEANNAYRDTRLSLSTLSFPMFE